MEGLRTGLRPRLPKGKLKVVKTNAERCASYRQSLKANPAAYKNYQATKQLATLRWKENLSEERRSRQRELNRLRQRERRARLKKQKCAIGTSTPPTTRKTRAECERQRKQREKARDRQRKHRARLTDEQKLAARKARMLRYYSKKEEQRQQTKKSEEVSKPSCSIKKTLQTSLWNLSSRRDKLSLLKATLLKKILQHKPIDTVGHHKLYQKRQRTDTTVENFFKQHSVHIPGKNTVSSHSLQQKKVLTTTISDLHALFLKEHPLHRLSRATFARRRPKHILLASSRAFIQCLCEICVNPMLKMEKLNPFLTVKVHSVDELVQQTLCEEEFNRACIDRTCEDCGVNKLLSSWEVQLDDKLDKEMTWWKWESTARSGKERVQKTGSLSEMLNEIRDEIEHLAQHVKTARWQRKQYNNLQQNLKTGHAMVTVDYAENYLCKQQNEVQSAHWQYKQVSVHPCVLQYKCDTAQCQETITEYIVFLSDDLRHDAGFTKTVLSCVLTHLKEKGMRIVRIFSDGCSSQYKSKLPFMHLTDLAAEHPEILIERHYFGSHHGKSLCDACGGVVKNCCTRAVASGRASIQGAEDMFQYCTESLTLPKEPSNSHHHLFRSFVYLPASAADRRLDSSALKTMPGTRTMHALKPRRERGKLVKKRLSCFCVPCVDDMSGCENDSFTGSWQPATVHFQVSQNRKHMQEPEEEQYAISTKPEEEQNVIAAEPEEERNAVSAEPEEKQFAISTDPEEEQNATAAEPEEEQNAIPAEGEQNAITAEREEEQYAIATEPEEEQNAISAEPEEEQNAMHANSKERENIFKRLQKEMCTASSFQELHSFAEKNQKVVNQFKTGCKDLCASSFPRDNTSMALYPDDAPLLTPVKVYGDGNCLYRCGSLLLFASEEGHVEVRIRTVFELALHLDYYLENKGLQPGGDLSKDYAKIYAQYSPNYTMEVLTQASIRRLLESEVLQGVRNGQYAGPWQIHALSSVLRTCLFTIYPQYGGFTVRRDLERVVLPRESTSNPPCFIPGIMWTSTTGKALPPSTWIPNHFVLCLPSDAYFVEHGDAKPESVDLNQDDRSAFAFVTSLLGPQ